MTKKINIAVSTPMQTMKQVASLRLYALTGEIVLGMAMVVFFTLFLSNLWVVGQYRFWIVITATVVFLILLVTVYLPGQYATSKSDRYGINQPQFIIPGNQPSTAIARHR